MDLTSLIIGCAFFLALIAALFLLYTMFEKNNRTNAGIIVGGIFILVLLVCGAEVNNMFFWKAFHPDTSVLEGLKNQAWYQGSVLYGLLLIIVSQSIYQIVKHRMKKADDWPPRFLVFK